MTTNELLASLVKLLQEQGDWHDRIFSLTLRINQALGDGFDPDADLAEIVGHLQARESAALMLLEQQRINFAEKEKELEFLRKEYKRLQKQRNRMQRAMEYMTSSEVKNEEI